MIQEADSILIGITHNRLGAITPEKKEPDQGFTVEKSLKRICDRISDDIWSCANLCDSYSKKRLLGEQVEEDSTLEPQVRLIL